MAQAASQTELMNALSNREPTIQITAGFSIALQINIPYPVKLESTGDQSFTLLKDSTHAGYLFRMTDGGSLTLENVILDGNSTAHPPESSENRSLILVTGGTLVLLGNTVIRNNNSYLEGGGIYLKSSPASPNMLSIGGNARVTDCYSRTNGGGIMIASENTNDNYTITQNAVIDGNRAAAGGGVLYRSYSKEAGAVLSIGDQVHLTNNTASSTGGGISFSGFRDGGGASSSLTFSGSALISGNSAAHGAGIYFYSANAGDRLALYRNAAVTRNIASQNGGGCFLSSAGTPADVYLEGASFTDNMAGTGGGLYLLTDSGGSLSVSQSAITGNRAAGGDSGSGGGIWIQNTSAESGLTVLLNSSSLEQNTASAHAGGLALYGGGGSFSFRITESSIADNQAAKEGGGLTVSNSGTGLLSFIQASVTNNTAGGSGGGIYYANTGSNILTTFILTRSDFSGNTAGSEGGGMRLTSATGSLITSLTDCTVKANTAQGSGGGIWNGGANNVLTIDGNTAVTQNSTEAGNGGGIYFNSENGTVYLSDSTQITYNLAEFKTNGPGGHGGGICLVPGVLNMQGQAVVGFNRAGKYGGGISAAESSCIHMTGGVLNGNHSEAFGGGLWIHGDSTAVITSGSFSGNEAPYGGDIYNDSYLYVSGERTFSDGVCIANRRSVVRLKNALTDSSLIRLEHSAYITPNAEGIPVVVGEADRGYPVLSQEDAAAFLKPADGFEGWEIQLSDDRAHVLLAPVLYQIHYENLMGSDQPNPDIYTVESPDILLLPPSLLPGYHFLGWFETPSGGYEITVIPHGSTGDLTLYARWEKITAEYTITFCGNACRPEACCIPGPVSVSAGESIFLPDLIPKRRGYNFCGWNTDPCKEGECFHPGEMLRSLQEDLELYAIWKRKRFFWF